MSEDRDIAIGQVWSNGPESLRWRVLAIGPVPGMVTVQRVDRPDDRYVWNVKSLVGTKDATLVGLPNARFWTWENDGWVKLTLKPGQTLRYCSGSPDDEGWWWSGQEFEYDADEGVVISRYTSERSDCDGRHSSYSDCECPLSDLQARPPEPADPEWGADEIPVPRPEWRKVSASQRDYYAEAMGY